MSEPEQNGPDKAARRICSACVGEAFLRELIERKGAQAHCQYCEDDNKTISIGELADKVDRAFEQHFSIVEETDDPYPDGQPSADAIADAADIPAGAGEDIRLILEERHFDRHAWKVGESCGFEPNVHYQEKGVDDGAYQEQWANFERQLRKETRFFSRIGIEILTATFTGVHEHKTRDNKAAVVSAGPSGSIASLFRARVFQSDKKLEDALKRPDLEVGPPQWRSAPAGRMNAQGIAIFYGAADVETALAEVRPPVGSRVVTAEFEIIRPIKLLDISVLEDVVIDGSLFDADYLPRLERLAFLKRLSEKMSRPVMPDDEPFEYLVTQAIADYLAAEQNIDGIIYPSAQTKSPHGNIAILHRAARVEGIPVAEGTTFDVRTESYTEDNETVPAYSVGAEIPAPKALPPVKFSGPIPIVYIDDFWSEDADYRTATLRIKVGSLRVHHVSSVKVNAEAYEVTRYETHMASTG